MQVDSKVRVAMQQGHLLPRYVVIIRRRATVHTESKACRCVNEDRRHKTAKSRTGAAGSFSALRVYLLAWVHVDERSLGL